MEPLHNLGQGRLEAEGMFPSDLQYRIPLSTEEFPALPDGVRVLHLDFFGHGLGFPLHPFVSGFLLFLGIQLHHLKPTGVLHIGNFIMFCECFLGATPI